MCCLFCCCSPPEKACWSNGINIVLTFAFAWFVWSFANEYKQQLVEAQAYDFVMVIWKLLLAYGGSSLFGFVYLFMAVHTKKAGYLLPWLILTLLMIVGETGGVFTVVGKIIIVHQEDDNSPPEIKLIDDPVLLICASFKLLSYFHEIHSWNCVRKHYKFLKESGKTEDTMTLAENEEA